MPKYATILSMAGREPQYGPTAQTVAANVTRWREKRSLNYKELSQRLKAVVQWELSPVSVRRIEDGERRVTVDDLMALAAALEVHPVDLLMPDAPGYTTETIVSATGFAAGKEPTAAQLWTWLRHPGPTDGDTDAYLQSQASLPWWQLYEVRDSSTLRASVKVERGNRVIQQPEPPEPSNGDN